jgi:hypothetical protein
MQSDDKTVMSLMTACLRTLQELLLDHTEKNFSIIIMTCPEGEKEVRLSECVESETVRKGMATVLARAIHGELPLREHTE